MEMSVIASLASDMAATGTQQAVQVAVMRKALDLEGQGALQLVQAATQGGNNPPHLGNSIDVFA